MGLMLFMNLLFALTTTVAGAGEPQPSVQLKDCGRVIGHEMGLWEFLDINPNPSQVDRVLKKRGEFYKVSLQQMKDGTWIVNHDPDRMARLGNGDVVDIVFKNTTWSDIERMQQDPMAWIPVYRLSDYVERDQGRLCWMFDMKDPVDQTLLDDLQKLGIQERTVIETNSMEEVQFLSAQSPEAGFHFSARIYSSAPMINELMPYRNQIWALEIDKSGSTSDLIKAAKQAGFSTYLDSMRYSWNYEFFGTACRTPFSLGADYTQTNRPLQCLHQMGW